MIDLSSPTAFLYHIGQHVFGGVECWDTKHDQPFTDWEWASLDELEPCIPCFERDIVGMDNALTSHGMWLLRKALTAKTPYDKDWKM